MSVHDQDHLDRRRPRRSPWSKGEAAGGGGEPAGWRLL